MKKKGSARFLDEQTETEQRGLFHHLTIRFRLDPHQQHENSIFPHRFLGFLPSVGAQLGLVLVALNAFTRRRLNYSRKEIVQQII